MTPEECDVFNMINNVRENNDLPPMVAVENCVKEARYNSELMFSLKNLSHNQPQETWLDRIKRFEALGNSMAENIAVSPGTQRLIDQWMGSQNHKKNIVNPKFNLGGVGRYENYWTQCFIEAPNPQQKPKPLDSPKLIEEKLPVVIQSGQ